MARHAFHWQFHSFNSSCIISKGVSSNDIQGDGAHGFEWNTSDHSCDIRHVFRDERTYGMRPLTAELQRQRGRDLNRLGAGAVLRSKSECRWNHQLCELPRSLEVIHRWPGCLNRRPWRAWHTKCPRPL
ncbi:hypothetical protein SMG44B_10040 [Stenotrophomonas maltophilia]